jgi:hypothetical protein
MTETKFVKRKKPNYKRAIVLLILLIIVLMLFFSVDNLLTGLFEVKD